MSEQLTIKVHELEEGRRYVSVRIGEGYDLMILTTPISEENVEEHERLMQRKVDELAMTMNEGDSE